jgi:hypothetical protein
MAMVCATLALMQVLKNFVNSEKAVATGLLVIGATVLTAAGQMTIDQWMGYTQVMAGIYVGGKALQGAAAHVTGARSAMAELEGLKDFLSESDAAADDAVDAKFGDEDEEE